MNTVNIENRIGYEADNALRAKTPISGDARGASFEDCLCKAVSGVEKTLPTTSNMSMDEYKQYISDKISAIPIHPSRINGCIAVDISEAGFEAMKNDPEYEKWVLDDLRTGWAMPDEWAGVFGAPYHVVHYGATKEECRAEGWYEGYNNGNGESLYKEKSEYCFWEHRMDLTERCFEQRQEMCIKKHYAKLHETERQMLLGKDYKGVIPTLSAAEILFDLLMDCGQ